MLNIIKDSARVHGGDYIGIVKHIKPSIWGSTCHQFYADILKKNIIKVDSTTYNNYVTLADKIKQANTFSKLSF